MFHLALAVLALGCAAHRAPLPAEAGHILQAAGDNPDTLGELIYTGYVHDTSGTPFTYERRVKQEDGQVVSSHLTLDDSGQAVVLHRATHDSDYALASFEEIHGQTGLSGALSVEEDARFSTTRGGEAAAATEALSDPVHVGPTLFGFVLQHWDALLDGEVRHLRFAVLDDARSYRFRLQLSALEDDRATFQIVATSPLVRMAVAPMSISFLRETRAVIRYAGPVPPLRSQSGRLRALDAVVEYEHHAPYR